jgi:uncharacterized phage-associated protein
MSHSSLAVANRILQIAEGKGLPLTIMQLIKLVYIAHGWTLALLDKALVSDRVEAWQHGPVYPEIYNEFRGSGWMPIDRPARDRDTGVEIASSFSEDEDSILDQVVTSYGKFHAFDLSARTHKPGTPWFQTFDGGRGKFSVIKNDLIKSHFDALRAAQA